MEMASKTAQIVLGATCVVLAALLVGCGGSSSGESTTAIAAPVRPSADECGLASSSLGGGERKSTKAASLPSAGIYRYAVVGSQTVSGSGVRAKDLAPRSETLITPSRKLGDLTCFRIQKRFASDIANTATYVVRGKDVYLVGLVVQALGESQEIKPDPAVLSASDSGSSWSGQFGGPTYGSYNFSVGGKRSYRVGGKRLRAVKISSSVAYRGDFNGTQVSTTWLALDENVVVAEQARSRQGFGVSDLRLRSRSRLLSLEPEPLPGA
jgi:hypothetical protein